MARNRVNRNGNTTDQPAGAGQMGTVVRVVTDRGFGFIRGTDERDYFFHRSGTHDFDHLHQGASVRFTPINAPKGPRAEGVERVE
jgi:cold shock CspA family protein